MKKTMAGSIAEPRKLTDIICDELENQIAEGVLNPGDKLPSERRLAQMFGVSRATVAKSIAQLEMKGLVRSRQGDGTFVCDTNEQMVGNLLDGTIMLAGQNLEELVEVRRGLECEMARLAGERATASDIERLSRDLRGMKNSTDHHDDFVHYDLQFHLNLAKASQNQLMLSLIHLIQKVMFEQMRRGTKLKGAMTKSIAAHESILDALIDSDGNRAAQAMEAHLSDTMAEVQRSTQSNDGGGLK